MVALSDDKGNGSTNTDGKASGENLIGRIHAFWCNFDWISMHLLAIFREILEILELLNSL